MNSSVDVPSAETGPDWVDLMVRYQGADSDATARLIAFASPLLYRFLASQLGSRAEAEDLLQEAWLKVHRARHTYRPGEPVLPWLYAIARHVRVDHYRKRRRISSHETVMEVLPEPAVRHGASSQAFSLPEFEALMAELPESQREVVTLLKVNDLSLEEVARITSSTVGAVKQKAHRAYERLRNLLTQPTVNAT
ncbi:MAG: RNA polymerase sigma factor [Acidobacteriaceae bacterium]|nr:RNA polymerase sigma factor [Acidobacteriaceae bacterium]MBV9223118.1 RNA polymerase sigma factor [Acidobacteriaceae bacterium]MBV9306303.1 RNA polymerase sigma factor [Acidobacteriaceae bacterium]MBV9675539.1 RNA polymerase sigma factor [Acidobacteriaceae bacterium]MBV9939733.1 RNA polymerase sigma factor [Acidobacteriaceae bacterium]